MRCVCLQKPCPSGPQGWCLENCQAEVAQTRQQHFGLQGNIRWSQIRAKRQEAALSSCFCTLSCTVIDMLRSRIAAGR